MEKEQLEDEIETRFSLRPRVQHICADKYPLWDNKHTLGHRWEDKPTRRLLDKVVSSYRGESIDAVHALENDQSKEAVDRAVSAFTDWITITNQLALKSGNNRLYWIGDMGAEYLSKGMSVEEAIAMYEQHDMGGFFNHNSIEDFREDPTSILCRNLDPETIMEYTRTQIANKLIGVFSGDFMEWFEKGSSEKHSAEDNMIYTATMGLNSGIDASFMVPILLLEGLRETFPEDSKILAEELRQRLSRYIVGDRTLGNYPKDDVTQQISELGKFYQLDG